MNAYLENVVDMTKTQINELAYPDQLVEPHLKIFVRERRPS